MIHPDESEGSKKMISYNYEAVSSEENNCGSCKYRVKDKYEEPCALCIKYKTRPNYIKALKNCFSCKHYEKLEFLVEEADCCLSCSLRHTKRDCDTCANNIMLEEYEEPCRSCELTSMGRTEYQNEDDIEE